ncbi:MAG: hypothetical protein JWQ75_2855 [Pseudarthrobacter sp.]|nr:hypothetical protein [Pseudarthrobacter sp.]
MYQQKASLSRDNEKTGRPTLGEPGTQAHQDHFVRHHIVVDVVTELTSGSSSGVMIVGDHGTGKSFIAQRALERLGKDHFVVQVRGSSVSSTLPYGALSVLLNEVDAAHVQHPLLVLRGLTQVLHKRAQGRPVVLFVDNAHDLDELSDMMVAQLSASGQVRLLAACSDLPGSDGDIMGLWKDDLLRRVDLSPFDFSEASAALSYAFHGNFSNSAARALWNASGGNALFLLTLAKEQVKQGILVRQAENWVLGERPIAFTGDVKDIVKARMNRLSAGQRDVFELLALAGSIPLQSLMKVARTEDVDALQESSVINVSNDCPPMVRIADSVTANIVANVVPSGRSAELRRRLAAVFEDKESRIVPAFNDVAWALACGEPVSDDAALMAARAANNASDPAAALRFIQEIGKPHKSSGPAVEAIWAHLSLNNHESAHKVLREFEDSARAELSIAEWTELQLAGSELDIQNPSTSANARVRLAELGSRIAAEQDGTADDLHTAPVRLRLAEAEVADFEGRFHDVLALLDGLETDEGTAPRVMAAGLQCTAIAVLGDVARALAMSNDVELAARSSALPDRVVREIRARHLQLLLLAGEFRKAEAYIASMSALAEPPSRLGGMFEVTPGVIDFLRGSVADAMPRLEAGLRQLKAHDPEALAGLATAAFAYASGLHGDDERATLLLAELPLLSPPASWLTVHLTRHFELCARYELGQRREALEGLLAEARRDTDVSADAAALQNLAAAGRFGDARHLPQLRDLSHRTSGRFSDLCARLAVGLATADSSILLTASQESENAGDAVFARDAARAAVKSADAAGNRISLRLAQRAQQSLESRFSGSADSSQSLATTSLTAREYEVAMAAAAGTSNRKIAEQMHVSIRTVEGHLYQIYAKLHVASRAELKDVIAAP